MPFPLIPLIAALGPSIISGAASAFGASKANQANRDMAREQMAFQERMSNTSYQRAMQDMRASGLNPMLAYQQGGASSPSGAFGEQRDVASPAVNSALASRRLSADLKLIGEQAEGVKAQAAAARQAGAHSASQAALNDAQIFDMGLNPAFFRGVTEFEGKPVLPLMDQKFWTPNMRLKMAEMASLGAGTARQVSELSEARARSGIFSSRFGPWLSGIRAGREALLGGSPFFVPLGRGR